MQNAAFYNVKDGILACKTWLFADQKVAFYKADSIIAVCRTFA